ncbi:MAG: bifunctional diaminohydroxyphosphoribosylaminopyrimidine deaminase/5-amino-6-(5-phosphoribosylamino)uracil reductase RibD [Acidobacteria bacterium]|nr:bifunctional diaminohydroxyphosphoribosylaminopyrimidine deaminase/5-amino-6-(5-phosphoribosylamino)uracil reductase RibD [Acidobacteriota bacterium]
MRCSQRRDGMMGDHSPNETDLRWMRRALELAARGRFGASPNPMVGAVILDVEGRLAGEGFHERVGGPHAEINALAEAGERARSGTLYVTLEPCNHYGKTPPCTDAILEAGMARVVIAIPDPNPQAGGGAARLRSGGVQVTMGVAAVEARRLNYRWLHWASAQKPWITLKAAVSLDGKVATRRGDSRWITCEAARRRSLELREEYDAILVGAGTVRADNPRLTRRLGLNPNGRWLRIVLDSALDIPADAALIREDPESVLLVHTDRAPADRRERFRDAGVRLLEIEPGPDGRPALTTLLRALAAEPVVSLLVEGGPAVHGSFNDAGLADEIELFLAPVIIGGVQAPAAIGGLGAGMLDEAKRYIIVSVTRHDTDVEIRVIRANEADVHRAD